MNSVRKIFEELIGLFIEDSSLAIGTIIWAAFAYMVIPHLPVSQTLKGIIFFLGVISILIENIARTVRKPS